MATAPEYLYETDEKSMVKRRWHLIILHAIRHKIRCNPPMNLITHSRDPALHHPHPLSISVMTFNVKMLLEFSSPEAASAIADYSVSAMRGRVIPFYHCYQETFNDCHRQRLVRLLGQSFSFAQNIGPRGARGWGIGSGLTMAVTGEFTQPPIQEAFAVAGSAPFENYARKGFQIAAQDIDELPVLLFHTHLASGGPRTNGGIHTTERRTQLIPILKAFNARPLYHHALLIGDLNVRREHLHFLDSTFADYNMSWNNLTDAVQVDDSVDHILYIWKHGHPPSLEGFDLWRDPLVPHLSDHAPIGCSIRKCETG